MSTVFSTDSLKAKDRFNYWHAVVSKHYAPCLGLTDNRNDFRATTTVNSLGSTELSQVVSQSIRYDRRQADLRTLPQDDIFISVMKSGEGYFDQNHRQVRHQRGDILIYDSAKPYCFNYTTDYKATLLRIPRPLLQAKLAGLDDLGGTIINNTSPFGRLIHSVMNNAEVIATTPELTSDAEAFIIPTLDVITTAISRATTDNDNFSASTHGKFLNEIKHYMRQHLTDEELTLDSVAQAKNISLRTLSRLFAEAGETPRHWLQEQRLSGAYNALLQKRVGNITEAALTFGYKDLSHFSRAFKKRYGHSPKTLIN